jgi:hypothetical protein
MCAATYVSTTMVAMVAMSPVVPLPDHPYLLWKRRCRRASYCLLESSEVLHSASDIDSTNPSANSSQTLSSFSALLPSMRSSSYSHPPQFIISVFSSSLQLRFPFCWRMLLYTRALSHCLRVSQARCHAFAVSAQLLQASYRHIRVPPYPYDPRVQPHTLLIQSTAVTDTLWLSLWDGKYDE